MDGYILRDGFWVPVAAVYAEQEQRIVDLEQTVQRLEETVKTMMVHDAMERLSESGAYFDMEQIDDKSEPEWKSTALGNVFGESFGKKNDF